MRSYFLLCTLVLFACGKTDTSVKNQPAENSAGNTNSKLNVQLVGQAMPNVYAAHLNWSNLADQNQKLFRTDGRGRESLLKDLPPESKTYLDTDIQAGESYTYRLQGSETSNSVTIAVPKDFTYNTNSDIETMNGGRLFLGRGVHLYTQGKTVKLKFDEIFADESFIETFPENATASVNQDGRSGGKLMISAKRLRGKIQFVARGENGGIGTPGQPGNRGSKGISGNPAQYICKLPGLPPQSCRMWEAQGVKPKELYNCTVTPTNGLPGSPGSAGGNGGQGRNGGNSGLLELQIEDLTPENLKYSIYEGKAGAGGTAGPGGPGGEGGDPGQEVYGICPARRGESGPNGAGGTTGVPGMAGVKENYCARLGAEVKGTCE